MKLFKFSLKGLSWKDNKKAIIAIIICVFGGSGIIGGFFTPVGQDLYKRLINYTRYKSKMKTIPSGMIFIGGGKFVMGSEIGSSNEIPHNVQINSFLLDKTEITQKQYESLMKQYYKNIYVLPHWSEENGKGDNLPAYFVNWFEAALFCNARTKEFGNKDDTVYTYNSIEGKINNNCRLVNCKSYIDRNGFRLPTEAEWEYSSIQSYKFLSKLKNPYEFGKFVNFNNNCDSMVQSIGKRKPIDGFSNLFGNVWEWCNDWYSSDYYNNSRIDNPKGPDIGDKKVVRGGSIYNTKNEGYFVPWKRHSIIPSIKWDSDSLRADVGFRCAKNFK